MELIYFLRNKHMKENYSGIYGEIHIRTQYESFKLHGIRHHSRTVIVSNGTVQRSTLTHFLLNFFARKLAVSAGNPTSSVATKLGFPRFAKHETRRNFFPVSRNFAKRIRMKFCAISRNFILNHFPKFHDTHKKNKFSQ